jgi:hypothetical protein
VSRRATGGCVANSLGDRASHAPKRAQREESEERRWKGRLVMAEVEELKAALCELREIETIETLKTRYCYLVDGATLLHGEAQAALHRPVAGAP